MILDLFAGPGGWSEGLRMIGRRDVGLEWDRPACSTRAAAGHATVQCDVARIPAAFWYGRARGLIASPPCQAFSMAGKGAGRREIDHIHRAIRACRAGWVADTHGWEDDRTRLILEPLRFIDALRPLWVALEQVPPALPIWEHYAELLRGWGYQAEARVLCAADWGVPQTRRRAFLLARLDGPVHWPLPTHDESPQPDLFGSELLPWVSMAEALGWGYSEEPCNTVRTTGGGGGGMNPITGGSGARRKRLRAQAEGRWQVADSRGEGCGRSPAFDPETRPARTVSRTAKDWQLEPHLNTGRDWKAGGDREDAQKIPLERPAPHVGGTSLRDWRLNPGLTPAQPHRRRRYRPDEPAPTIGFGHDSANWYWTRPATTVAGDPRVHPPGHKENGDDPPGRYAQRRGEDALRVSVAEAAVLQGFPADYPFQGTKTQQFEQVGNAVCPPWAAAIIQALDPEGEA